MEKYLHNGNRFDAIFLITQSTEKKKNIRTE